jgi:GT2 family glycosyltransferase
MKKAALICVTRNNALKLQTTLNSIIRHTKAESYDLYIIDNASTDETLGIYQEVPLADNITIVRSGKNLHWVGGINLGIDMTKGYQYVGFLNDDIEVCPNWLENFFDVLDCNLDVAAVGPISSSDRNWEGYDNLRRRFLNWGLPTIDGVDRKNIAEIHKHISTNGSGCKIDDPLDFFCILLRRSAIERIGYLDSAFAELGCGYNDDFCERLKFLNFRLALSTRTYVFKNDEYSYSNNLNADKISASKIVLSKKNAILEQKKPQFSEAPREGVSLFIEMKSFWEPLVKLMPFHNYCAEKVSVSQPFPSLGSYVFNPGKRFAICTLYTPEIVRYAAESEKSIISYCIKNDYTAYIYRQGIYEDIHPAWHKARVILNHLANHSEMVWVDADTLILQQHNKCFETVAKNPKEFHISRDLTNYGPTIYNSGVFIVKNSDWATALLQDWDQFAQTHRPARLWDHGSDQKVLCDLILSKDSNREFHEAYEMSVFNTDPRFVNEETFLLHFMSYPLGYRIPWMSYWNANNLHFREEHFIDRIQPL